MTDNLIEAWEQFKSVLRFYGNALAGLNPPCPTMEIAQFERHFNLEMADSLKDLLEINNGQQVSPSGRQKGIFKSLSGWDVYERHVFLDQQGIYAAYDAFIKDEVLLAEFGTDEIPFAVAGTAASYREAFCIQRTTGCVSLIWTLAADPFQPAEWQVQRFSRADSLAQFIGMQTGLYR